jgi:mannosyltransferase
MVVPSATPAPRAEPRLGTVPLALAGLVLLGAALRLVGLGAEPLWLDEAFSWRWAHLPFTELWGAAARTETNPPLWFTLERWVLLTMGDAEAVLRLPAALLGVAAIPLAFLAGRSLAGPLAGLGAALLLATDPLLVAYSQEARGYSLFVAGTLLVLWGTVELAPDRRGSGDVPAGRGRPLLPGFAYASGATLAIYAHNTGPLVLVLANLAFALLWLTSDRRDPRRLVPWVLANLPPLLLGLWWLPVLLEQSTSAVNVGWIAQPSVRRALFSWTALFGPHFLPAPPLLAALLGLPVLLLAALGARRLGRAATIPLMLTLGGPLLLFLLGLFIRPLWLERVLLPYLACALVLAGAGMARIERARAILATLLLLVLVPRTADLAAWHGQPQKLAWPEAVEAVRNELRSGDAVLILPHFYHWPFAYHAGRAGLAVPVLGIVSGPPPPAGAPFVEPVDRGLELVVPEDLVERLNRHPRAWLLAYKRRGGDPGGVLTSLSRLGRLEVRGEWSGLWDRGELELFAFVRARDVPGRADPPGR